MTRLADMLQLRRFTSGRAAFAAARVLALAKAGTDGEIEADARAVIDSAIGALGKRREWAKGLASASSARAGGKAVELDKQVDRLVSAIYNNTSGFVRSLDPGAAEATRASALLTELFPRGVADLTNRAFEDEAAAVAQLLGDLQGRFASDVAALGLTPLVQRLSQVHDAFERALSETQPSRVSHDEVTRSEGATQELLATLAIRIMGRYPAADSTPRRSELLAPILEQDGRIRDALRRNRPVTDVDPETGQETDELPQG